jgi:predicted permease
MPEHRDRTTDITALDTIVAPGTFAALGIPLRRGRDFDDGDTADRPPVAIVNEALVRGSFGTQDPIGRTIFCPFDRPDGMTIVGVVGDVRTNNPSVEAIPECYMPYQQHAYNRNTLHVVARTSADPTSLIPTLRRISAESARDVPVSFTTMNELLSNNVAEPRFRALLLGTFAALAVCLAMAGVYGVMAYAVQQRSNEIGLRMALGASRSSVLRLILTQAMILAAGGLAVGLSISLASTRLLGKMLFRVEPIDAAVYAAAIALVAAVTLVAGFMPARRAAIMDPMMVLKSE